MALATRPLKDILPLVLPFVPGCPNMTAVQALRMAAITFCERTRIWREILTVTITGEDQAVITPAHAALHEIEQAYWGVNQIPLEPVLFADTTSLDRDITAPVNDPSYITQSSENTVTVLPFATGDLTVYAILKPLAGPEFGVTGTTTEQDIQNVIPEFLFKQYSQHIANGAIALLKRMPETQFEDLKGAFQAKDEFIKNIDASQNRNIKGQHKAVVRSQAQWM